jgi:(E)-4-hydroxy-3-methylbut-2-enyl-diphosphate synthase
MFPEKRRKTKIINVGKVKIGGGHPIVIQTMTNSDTKNIRKTLNQIRKLALEGAELLRVAITDEEAVQAFKKLVQKSPVPLIADIHFNYKLALMAVEAGAAKIRINPGTIGPKEKVKEIINKCYQYQIPIRIGINAASLPRNLRSRDHLSAMLEAARYWIGFFEDNHFTNLVISAKSSNTLETIRIYELLSSEFNYPLHLGLTESGPIFSGSIKSAAALGVLLYQGIGDTIRISLSTDPVYEVRAARVLLRSLGLLEAPEIISCPTCARTSINVEKIAARVERLLTAVKKPIKVAVMGCEVNGPGEARDADLGLAGTKRGIILFKKGQIVGIYSEKEAYLKLMELIKEEFLKEAR